jgi:hypothetical protein
MIILLRSREILAAAAEFHRYTAVGRKYGMRVRESQERRQR